MKRRDFLTNSVLTGVGIPLGVAPLAFSSCNGQQTSKTISPEELGMFSFATIAPDGKPLKAALIGCGSRGTGAAVQFLAAGSDLSIIALADVFADRMESCRKTLKEHSNNEVPDTNCFIGFDAFRKVLDMNEVELVLLCTPTFFRPEHFKAAIDAGKHVFMEKPCAVDPTGVRTVLVSAKAAMNKGLTVVTGTHKRHRRDYWEAFVQVRNRLIGDLIHATAHGHQGAMWFKNRRPEWNDMEYCIRNWFNIYWLSGGLFIDQTIHNIDVATWFLGQFPTRAIGMGGRAQRTIGDTYDFQSVDYHYEKGKRMLATGRQIDGCDGNFSEQIYGSKGIAFLTDSSEDVKIMDYNGNILWKYDYEAMPVKNPYEQEHIHLVESIRQNKKINQAEALAYSCQIAILGCEAAFTGKALTWEEMMSSGLRYGPEKIEFGNLPNYQEGVVPVPGQTPKAT